MKSTMFSLNTRDAIKGAIMAIGTPVLYFLQDAIPGYNLHPMLQVAISALITYLLKNFFTNDVETAKKIAEEHDAKIVPKDNPARPIAMILILVSLSLCGMAQSFFKPIPIKKQTTSVRRNAIEMPTAGPTFWALRPIASAATIFVNGSVEAAAGGGFSYQNITQGERNYVNYAISALILAGGAVVPNKPSDIEKFGLMISALNNAIGAGIAMANIKDPLTSDKRWKAGLMVVWTINFNN